MREMIKAFSEAGHDVTPLIMGGLHENGADRPASASRGSMKAAVKKLVPGIFWETTKDYALLKKDRTYEEVLRQHVDQTKPDLIYERGNYLQRSGIRIARSTGVPHVLEMNSPQVEERKVRHASGSLLERRARRIEKEQLQGTSRVAVVSRALKNHFARAYAIPDEHIICTPNAIDPDKLVIDPRRVIAIKDRYGLEGSTVLGFVGSVLKWHRVDLLIRACHQLRQEAHPVKVLIVGMSRLIPELKALSQQLGISEAVLFVGRVPHEDVFNFVEAMDITVLPDNLWYQSPVKVFEYGAMGKPIIAPDNETVRDLIKHEEEGLLVKPSIEDLTASIQKLSNTPEYARVMAETFQAKVLQEFKWSRNVERVLDSVFSMPGQELPL